MSQHQHHPTCPRKEDLVFGTLLGEGAFARVVHVRDIRCGTEYALKVVDKRLTQAKGRTSSVLAERSLLLSFSHPGIVGLRFCFQDEFCLYFVLEYIAGGELATQISRMGVCSFEFTQFYAAEIVTILEYLRKMKVAHRDLKPENILVTLDGHLKLIDFDAAVMVPGESECEGDAAAGCFKEQPKLAGTAYYLPPEVLLGTAKAWEAFALDMWALGCIIYYMLVGRLPFDGESQHILFQNIIDMRYTFPVGFGNHEAMDLIGGLLQAEPCNRLGTTTRKKESVASDDLGIIEVKSHIFFGGSLALFDKLGRVSPPQRLKSRSSSNVQLASKDCSSSFDFTSSAECTPEIGEGFSAWSSTAITVEMSLESHTDSEDEDEAAMAIEELITSQAASSTATQMSDVQMTTGMKLQSMSQLAALSMPRAEPRQFMARDRIPRDWQATVNLPFASAQLWLGELLRKRLLLKQEDVSICGNVVKRRLRCLKPKVLVLTTLPRLLLLDSKGLKLCAEFDLTKAGVFVIVNSPVEFVIVLAKKRYKCYDHTLGAEEWHAKVSAARHRALSHLSM